MNNAHNQTITRKAALFGVAIMLAVIWAGTHGPLPGVSGQSRPSDQTTPAATIDKIVVNETNVIDALGNVTVTRANRERVQPVTTGLLLYRGDVIETAPNTKVTILFLDSASELHNQIIIDGDAKVGISSSNTWWGRTWVKVKSFFVSKTTYVQVGARGTEWEFDVSKDGRATVITLEGSTQVTRGTFDLVGRLANSEPNRLQPVTRTPQFLPASFRSANAEPQQPGRALDVPGGEITTFDVTYRITNGCGQTHRVEFRISDSTPWLQLDIQRRWELTPGQTRDIKGRLSIDARRLPPGQHRAEVNLLCPDCREEAQCFGTQITWPYNVTVGLPRSDTPPRTPTPTPPPSPTPPTAQSSPEFTLNALEQTVVTNSPEPAGPQRASEAQVRSVLDWTNRVILKTQPSYSAEGLIPHYSNVEQRSQNFTRAREAAILRSLPGSNKIVGDIYSDWGQPALAAGAYEKEGNVAGAQAPSQSLSVDYAEAQRLTGKLDQARTAIQTSADSRSAAAQNLLGNIYFDYARIDLDKKDWGGARRNLEQAERFYRSALPAVIETSPRTTPGDKTLQANLAETLILQGDLALKEALQQTAGAQTEAVRLAKSKYSEAMQSLGNSLIAESTYPFGVQTLGQAYQGLGDAAKLSGERADDLYANARNQLNRIIAAHPDCAEAYFRLGDLYDNLGDKENAKLNYRRAIQTRPEQPASYYPLALHLQTEDPRLAAALAATYLKLEPEVFKQGEKARNAQRIMRGERVPQPERIGTTTTTVGRSVPGVVNMPLAQATRELETAGYRDVKVERRSSASPRDTVINQSPSAGTPALATSPINLTVSLGPPDVPLTVPNVRDMTLAQATSAIESANLRVGRVTEKPDNNKPKGIVLKQKPEAGRRAEAGTPVELEVATSRPVEVPNIVNDREATARKEILERRLTVGNVSQRPSCEVGKVIEQNPVRGTPVEPGRAVDFVVGSLGDNPVTIPNLRGRDRAAAEREIQDIGLTLERVRTEESDQPEGTVLKQSQDAGKQFARECRVRIQLTVAIPLTVGNYVGSREGDARFQISMKGFSASVNYEDARGQLGGIVLRQDPPPGTPARRGSLVTLTVSRQADVSVPDVRGRSPAEARRILEASGLRLGTVSQGRMYSEQYPRGTIETQTPSAGQTVPAGTPVNVVLSPRGTPEAQTVTVPRVWNMSERDARTTIERAGLRVASTLGCTVAYVGRAPVAIGNAAGTNPPEGTPLAVGTAVTLIIARASCGQN